MVHISVIEARLSQLGVRVSMLFRPEIQELQKVLVDNEEIVAVVPGRYFGGFALLAATNRRLLLIDKKMAVLSLEDIRYDMISEVNFGSRMLDATLVVFTLNKQHRFTSFKYRHKLRELTTYVQQRVMELRYGQQPVTVEAEKLSYPAVNTLGDQPVQPAQIASSQPSLTNTYGSVVSLPAHLGHFSHLRPKLVGAAALHDTPWMPVNPYTRTSLTVRSQWSRGESGRYSA